MWGEVNQDVAVLNDLFFDLLLLVRFHEGVETIESWQRHLLLVFFH